MTEDHYPSPKEALFGNGHIANMRCAVKYFVWQASYILIFLVGTLLFTLYTAYQYTKSGIVRGGSYLGAKVAAGAERVAGSRTTDAAVAVGRPVVLVLDKVLSPVFYVLATVFGAVGAAVTSSRVKMAARGIVWLLIGAFILAASAAAVLMALTNPALFLAGVGTVTLILADILGWVYVLDSEDGLGGAQVAARGASSAASKAKETPGVRRVYGNCPVHMDLEPKWFDRITDIFD